MEVKKAFYGATLVPVGQVEGLFSIGVGSIMFGDGEVLTSGDIIHVYPLHEHVPVRASIIGFRRVPVDDGKAMWVAADGQQLETDDGQVKLITCRRL